VLLGFPFLFCSVSDVDKVLILCWACVNLRVAQLQEEESALWREM